MKQNILQIRLKNSEYPTDLRDKHCSRQKSVGIVFVKIKTGVGIATGYGLEGPGIESR
jgi:hypothetical protein